MLAEHGEGAPGAEPGHADHQVDERSVAVVVERRVAGELAEPLAVRVFAPVVFAGGVGDGERQQAADVGGLVEDATHSFVRCERGAFDDADLGQLGGLLGVDGVVRFVVDDLGEVLEVADVGRVDRVERTARHLVYHGSWRAVDVGQRVDAGLTQRRFRRGRFAARSHEGAQHEPQPERAATDHLDEPVRWDVTAVAGRDEEVAAAGTVVRSGHAEIAGGRIHMSLSSPRTLGGRSMTSGPETFRSRIEMP